MIGIRLKLISILSAVIIAISALACLFFFVHAKTQQEESLKKFGMSIVTSLTEDDEIKFALSHAQPAFLDAKIKKLHSFDRDGEIGYWRITYPQKTIIEGKSQWIDVDIKGIPTPADMLKLNQSTTEKIQMSDSMPGLESYQNQYNISINCINTPSGEVLCDFSVPVYEKQKFSEEAFVAEILGGAKIDKVVNSEILGYVQVGLSNRRVIERINKIILYRVIPMGIGIILGGISFTFFLISRYLVRPLKQLTNITMDIAKGNLSETIKINSNDEIGQLSKTFNKMTMALGKSYADLQYRVKMEELIADISTGFINLPTHEAEEGINLTLRSIVEFTGVDRSYVPLISEDSNKIDYIYEWCAKGIKSIKEDIQGLSIEHYPWWMEKLKKFETVYIPKTTNLPDSGGTGKEIILKQEIKSVVIVPLVYSEKLIGFLGFDSVKVEKTWTDQDITLFKMIGEILVNFLKRKHTEELIKLHVQRLTALHAIDRTIVSNLDLKIILNAFLEQLTTQIGIDAADILLLNQSTQELQYFISHGFRTNAILNCTKDNYAYKALKERRIIHIPDLYGTEVNPQCAKLFKEESFASYYGIPLISKGLVKGVLEVFHRSQPKHDREWLSFLESIGAMAAIAIDNASLFDSMQRSNKELMIAYDTTIEGWSRALDLRDKETEGHSQRVTEMTLKLARIIGVNENDLIHIKWGALLHDIGKMGVPDDILLKPDILNKEEEKIMHKHPEYAYQLLSPIAHLHKALEIPHCHHERWDGSGYPNGLKGEQIPLVARIFAIVDVRDALHSSRPYRDPLSDNEVIENIQSQACTHFDPKIVKIFLEQIPSKHIKS